MVSEADARMVPRHIFALVFTNPMVRRLMIEAD